LDAKQVNMRLKQIIGQGEHEVNAGNRSTSAIDMSSYIIIV